MKNLRPLRPERRTDRRSGLSRAILSGFAPFRPDAGGSYRWRIVGAGCV